LPCWYSICAARSKLADEGEVPSQGSNEESIEDMTPIQKKTLCKKIRQSYKVDGFLGYINRYIDDMEVVYIRAQTIRCLHGYIKNTIRYYSRLLVDITENEIDMMTDNYLRSRKLPPSNT
jgi:hypothetical protein